MKNKLMKYAVSMLLGFLSVMTSYAASQTVIVTYSWLDGSLDTSGSYLEIEGDRKSDRNGYVIPVDESRIFKAIVPIGHDVSMWSFGKIPQTNTQILINQGHYDTVDETTVDAYEWKAEAAGEIGLAVHLDWLKYRVDFSGSSSTGGSMPSLTDIIYTNRVQLVSNRFTRLGYDFLGWSRSENGQVEFTDGAEISGAILGTSYTNKTIRLYAVWQPRRITVEFDPGTGDGAAVSETSRELHYDSLYGELPIPTRTAKEGRTLEQSYRFDGWFINDDTSPISAETKVSEVANHKLVARWTELYEVIWRESFEFGGDDLRVDYLVGGVRATPPTLPRHQGYENLGWTPNDGFDNVLQDRLYTASYKATYYDVRFNAPDATSGAMETQRIYASSDSLATNAFIRLGYTFKGWADTPGGNIIRVDGAPSRGLAQPAETIDLYAVWSSNAYYVDFFGNGGTNTMSRQSFVYDTENRLQSCAFKRLGYVFEGWTTDPRNAVEFLPDAPVTNLTAEANGIIRLYAKWKSLAAFDSPLSIAADCAESTDNWSALDLSAGDSAAPFSISQDKGGNDKCIEMNSPQTAPQNAQASFSTTIGGRGVLSFWYRTQIKYETDPKPSNLSLGVSGEGIEARTIVVSKKSVGEWTYYEIDFNAPTDAGEKNVEWIFTEPFPVDGDFALIDCIRWVPHVRETGTIGITFRLNDGTVAPHDIWTNITETIDAPYRDWPSDPASFGYTFAGWRTSDGTPVASTNLVPAADCEFFAAWNSRPQLVAVPEPVTGLIFNGGSVTGVVATANIVLSGNVATNAGNYVAMAKPAPGYAWEDESDEAKSIAWTIAKATYDMSGVSFKDATYTYDGKEKSLIVSGALPSGVVVTYSNHTHTAIGSYKALAVFTGDADNYALIDPLSATMTIVGGRIDSERHLYAENYADASLSGNVSYRGWLTHDGQITGLFKATAHASIEVGAEVTVRLQLTPHVGKRQVSTLRLTQVDERHFTAEGVALELSASIMRGTLMLNGELCEIVGGCDFLRSSDVSVRTVARATAKRREVTFTADTPEGRWTFSVVMSRGTARTVIRVYTPDGEQVSLVSYGVFGENLKTIALPVVYPDEKIGFGFVLWCDENGNCEVTELTLKSAAVIGPELVRKPSGSVRLMMERLPASYMSEFSPANLCLSFGGLRWRAPRTPASFHLHWTKEGIVRGSFLVYERMPASMRARSARIFGVAVGETVYANAILDDGTVLCVETESVE